VGITLKINLGLGVLRIDSKKQSSSFIFLKLGKLVNISVIDITRSCLKVLIREGFKEISIK
jgi:hypothetical protein